MPVAVIVPVLLLHEVEVVVAVIEGPCILPTVMDVLLIQPVESST